MCSETDFQQLEEGPLLEAANFVWNSADCKKTPMLLNYDQTSFDQITNTKTKQLLQKCHLHLKLENEQKTGSFKIRGIVHQLRKKMKGFKTEGKELCHPVTFSGGNYGRAFATMMSKLALPATVIMATTVPQDRVEVIRGLGCHVVQYPKSELTAAVESAKRDNTMTFFDPFDDIDLIQGYASLAFEILEETPTFDVILVPCGGGGLLSGIAAALRSKGYQGTIFGVEPITANTMRRSFDEGVPVEMSTAHSIAAGLSPPYCGKITYGICHKMVDDILTVSDEEILAAMKLLYEVSGMMVEPSGVASLAAFISGKVLETNPDANVVCVLSGGNITKPNLDDLINM